MRINNNVEEFRERVKNSHIVCHGAGNNAYSMLNNDEFGCYLDRILFFVDRDEKRVGTYIGQGNRSYAIKSVDDLKGLDNYVVLITVSDYKKIGDLYNS